MTRVHPTFSNSTRKAYTFCQFASSGAMCHCTHHHRSHHINGMLHTWHRLTVLSCMSNTPVVTLVHSAPSTNIAPLVHR